MSQGKPILAMINGDGAELVKEADCGLAVNAGDAKSFADSVLTLSKMSVSSLQNLGLNGKNYYQAHFTKQDRINQLKELLEIEYEKKSS